MLTSSSISPNLKNEMQTRTFDESQGTQNLLSIKKTRSRSNGTIIDRRRKKNGSSRMLTSAITNRLKSSLK